MTAKGPYSRLYHRLMTEYPSVWRSDAQLALLVRLLVAAEKYYPEWPTSNRRNGAYQSLLKAGLVIEKEGTDGYTIRGLEAERERRSHAASNAAASRWGMPRRDETSKDKTSNGASHAERTNGTFLRSPKRGSHDGQHHHCMVCEPIHPAGCAVCAPLQVKT